MAMAPWMAPPERITSVTSCCWGVSAISVMRTSSGQHDSRRAGADEVRGIGGIAGRQ